MIVLALLAGLAALHMLIQLALNKAVDLAAAVVA